jgi:hypothetical protein
MSSECVVNGILTKENGNRLHILMRFQLDCFLHDHSSSGTSGNRWSKRPL